MAGRTAVRATRALRWMARLQVRGLDRTRLVWVAIALAAARLVTGCPAAARRVRVLAVPRTIRGTARTPTRVAGRRRSMRVRTAVPLTMWGRTWRSAARSAADKLATVAAPAIASASASVCACEEIGRAAGRERGE